MLLHIDHNWARAHLTPFLSCSCSGNKLHQQQKGIEGNCKEWEERGVPGAREDGGQGRENSGTCLGEDICHYCCIDNGEKGCQSCIKAPQLKLLSKSSVWSIFYCCSLLAVLPRPHSPPPPKKKLYKSFTLSDSTYQKEPFFFFFRSLDFSS